jgi:hypothetical protein
MFNYSKFIWFDFEKQRTSSPKAFKTLDINRMDLSVIKKVFLNETLLKQFLRMKREKISERQIRRKIDDLVSEGGMVSKKAGKYENPKSRTKAVRGILKYYAWKMLKRLSGDNAFLRKIIIKYAKTNFLNIAREALQFVKPDNNLYAHLITASNIKIHVRWLAFEKHTDDDFKTEVIIKRIRKKQSIENWFTEIRTRKGAKEIYDALMNVKPEYQKSIYSNAIAVIKRELDPKTSLWKRWSRTKRT